MVEKSVEIEGGTYLATSGLKFRIRARVERPKRLDGDPFGDKKVGLWVPWSSGPSQHTLGPVAWASGAQNLDFPWVLAASV